MKRRRHGAALEGYAERQRARVARRRAYAEAAAGHLPVWRPASRPVEPTFETPRTGASHIEHRRTS